MDRRLHDWIKILVVVGTVLVGMYTSGKLNDHRLTQIEADTKAILAAITAGRAERAILDRRLAVVEASRVPNVAAFERAILSLTDAAQRIGRKKDATP